MVDDDYAALVWADCDFTPCRAEDGIVAGFSRSQLVLGLSTNVLLAFTSLRTELSQVWFIRSRE
jgi:hypothetical protein